MNHSFEKLFGSGDVPGYLSDEDMRAIAELSKLLPQSAMVVEIGSFLGKSAVEWAKNLYAQQKNHKILCVESFNSPPEVLKDLLQKADFVVPAECESQIDLFKHYTKQYQSICPVHGFFNHSFVFPTVVDLVFEDSTHEFHYLTYALPFWWKTIKPGGILSGHDYTIGEVKMAVDLFASIENVEVKTFNNSSIWWIVKPKVKA